MSVGGRPNLLLITTDTQRWDTVAAYGGRPGRDGGFRPHSPGLDRLAREGVLFTQGHTPAPVCMPARCSLMTGTHTPVHGCIENGVARREHLAMLPDLLAAAGYRTVMVGKTHFGPLPAGFQVRHVLRGEKHADGDDFYAAHIRAHGYPRSTRHPNPIPEELFVDAFLADTAMREIDTAVAADASWRVPLVLSQPGTLPQGQRRDFAIWNDVTATLLAAAGADLPSVQGFDLYGPLRRSEPSPRTFAVGSLYTSCAVATRRWKLEYYLEERSGRLFDRAADPDEQRDLYADPAHREVRDALRHALLAWRADLTDVQWLQAHTGGGGPVAERAARHTAARRGTDAEHRLGDQLAPLDSWPTAGWGA